MALVLVFYGPPFNPLLWPVAAAPVVAAVLVVAAVSALCPPSVESVIAGYSGWDGARRTRAAGASRA